MNYEKLANELNTATEVTDYDKEDGLNVIKDPKYPSGYRVDISWRAGTSGDGNDHIDLDDIWFEVLDNKRVNAVLDRYRGV